MKDSRHKYIDLFRTFEHQANGIKIACKISQRNCEFLAKRVGAAKPRTPAEFEKVEELKAFIASTSDANEKMVEMLDYVFKTLVEVASDCKDLLEIAKLKDTLQFQSDTIVLLMNEQKHIIELKDEIRRGNKATP